MAVDENSVVRPEPAATVALVRDGELGLQTYLLQRASSMAFASGMHVFPGGRVEERDFALRVAFVGDHAAERARLAARASTGLRDVCALYACAVRETAEETGVILAAPAEDGTLHIDAATMPIVDHWITPTVLPKRYDTRFFAAVVPSDQEAELTTTEAVHAEWVWPAHALQRAQRKEIGLMPPTAATIRYLAGFQSCADLLVDAADRAVVPTLPVVSLKQIEDRRSQP